jgi:hypothetical protein
MARKSYTLIGADGKPYESTIPMLERYRAWKEGRLDAEVRADRG